LGRVVIAAEAQDEENSKASQTQESKTRENTKR